MSETGKLANLQRNCSLETQNQSMVRQLGCQLIKNTMQLPTHTFMSLSLTSRTFSEWSSPIWVVILPDNALLARLSSVTEPFKQVTPCLEQWSFCGSIQLLVFVQSPPLAESWNSLCKLCLCSYVVETAQTLYSPKTKNSFNTVLSGGHALVSFFKSNPET